MREVIVTPTRSAGPLEHPSPPLALLASVYAGLFLTSLIVHVWLAGGDHIPSPFDGPGAARAFFAAHPTSVRWSGFLQFCAAIPLTLFAVVTVSRLRFLGVHAAGAFIALGGGILAGAMQILAALALWTLSLDPDGAAVRSLQLFAFAAGGPAFVTALGLFVAGSAVSAGLAGLVSRPLLWTGLALAVLAELSVFAFVFPAASYLLPIVRLGTFGWLIWLGAVLPRAMRLAGEAAS
jgi:hypothetical protein